MTRQMITGEEVGGRSSLGKQSSAMAKELWNVWEIHCLILLSLFLQMFLFLTAGMRRRSTSGILRTVLWLAYLSADSVAIFVLGHLAVHASQPGHQLMSFWAPFVLVHLGGQDTITALSKQDNELWKRHLLSLVTQVAVAGYVVAKATWPDRRLRAAMVIMFLSGCFKYVERTLCLYTANPAMLRHYALNNLSEMFRALQGGQGKAEYSYNIVRRRIGETLDMMSKGSPIGSVGLDNNGVGTYIMSVDVPINMVETILVAEDVPALMALVLFIVAEKGGQLRATNKADIIVSYTLLVGAVVLDGSTATISIVNFMWSFNLPAGILRVANCIQPAWSKKQWSEELAQYSMIKRHSVQDATGMASIRQWIGRHLGAWGVGLLELTHIPITRDHTPIKEFILDNLLGFGTRKEWNIASSRGEIAIQKWRSNNHQDPDSALLKSISVDFPTSVLIWHIATDICYYCGDDAITDSEQMRKDKQMSKELSNYIVYLVFKCGVMLTTNSQHAHDKAHGEIKRILTDQQVNLGDKDNVKRLFEAIKKEQQDSRVTEILAEESGNEQQDSTVVEIQKHEETDDNGNAADSRRQKLLQSTLESLDYPVLLRACEVAQELISINDDAKHWGLIASVWLEMLYYTAPRCGGAFHYEHLSKGGEFITHIVLLMRFLGPFLPPLGV